MKEIWKEAVGNLLTVKSIVTLVLTLVFSVLAVTSRIDGGQFLNIFLIVIAFLPTLYMFLVGSKNLLSFSPINSKNNNATIILIRKA